MTQRDQLGADLEYVRSIVDNAEPFIGPATIYWMWAAISLVGFSLYDHDPRTGSIFWAFAGPIGGVASLLLGRRAARKQGQASWRIARYHALHWCGMLGAIFLVVALAARGVMGEEALARVILLILAFGYYTAGIYLVRRMLWIGLLLVGCFVGMLFFKGLGWTIVGVLLALSLLLSSMRGGRSGRV